MPPALVPKRVEDFIFYYYAKLVMAPSAGFKANYRFVIDAYKRLRSGRIHISDYDREIQRLAQQRDRCAYCQKKTIALEPSEVVPRSMGGPIGMHNQVLACTPCRRSKEGRDLLDWWRNTMGRHHDDLPRVPAGLYLKQAYEAHRVHFTLGEKCTDLAQLFSILPPSAPGMA